MVNNNPLGDCSPSDPHRDIHFKDRLDHKCTAVTEGYETEANLIQHLGGSV